jgi:hypothetical protein
MDNRATGQGLLSGLKLTRAGGIEFGSCWHWKMCAAVRTVRTRYVAAMRINDRLANGEASADSGILGAEEAIEDMLKVRGGNARPIVTDGKDDRTFFGGTKECS